MTYWDKICDEYIESVHNDITGIFAYENEVNTPSILSLCPSKAINVLDLGCGDGRFTNELIHKYKNVIAVDNSNPMLKFAQKKYPGADYANFNIEHTFPKFNGQFDLITAKLLLMYIKNLDNFAIQCYKNLRTNGSLVVSVTHPAKWLTEYLSEKRNVKEYKGYLSETIIEGNIAHNSKMPISFISRSTQTYVNTFTKHGFILKALLETEVPDTFVLKYPNYLFKQKDPFRLNLKFIKQ